MRGKHTQGDFIFKIAILQTRIPDYRDFFFKSIIEDGHLRGYSIDVYRTGIQFSSQVGESTSEYSGFLKFTKFSFFNSKVQLTHIPLRILRSKYIVIEHKLSDLSIYLLLLFLPSKIILWGHGKSVTTSDSLAISSLRILLARRARMYLAYTEEGSKYLIENGVNPTSVKVLVNSLDTDELVRAKRNITSEAIENFETKFDLKDKRIIAYIGALESYKKIDLLVEALQILESQNFSVTCLFLGSGDKREFLRNLNHEQLILLERGKAEAKAMLAYFAKFFVVPGRVGLVAIDSIFFERVILTTNWKFHAPEFHYLTPGSSVVVSESDSRDYASHIKKLFLNSELRNVYEKNLHDLQNSFSGKIMVKNFTQAILSLENIS